MTFVTEKLPPPEKVNGLLPRLTGRVSVSVPPAKAELIVAPPLPIVIGPAYELLPLTLFSAPAGLAARPAPVMVSGIAPMEMLFCNSSAAPEATVTPDEVPKAPLLCRLSRPAFRNTGPVKLLLPRKVTLPVPFLMIAVGPPASGFEMPAVLPATSENVYATALELVKTTDGGVTPAA